ncbi:hypothetical protein Bbelb_324950 [Branchiostoma belcheri]|nr:hypothetical protein Bbelb_324950 [Branchiostoma belcheri]
MNVLSVGSMAGPVPRRLITFLIRNCARPFVDSRDRLPLGIIDGTNSLVISQFISVKDDPARSSDNKTVKPITPLCGCWAQSSIGLKVPGSVDATAGHSAVLQADFDTTKRIASVVWTKVDSMDKMKRTQVFTYWPHFDSSTAHGDYNGRARLDVQGEASLVIDDVTEEDEGTYIITVSAEGLPSEEAFVDLRVFVPPSVSVGPSDPYVTSWGRGVTLTCAVRNAKPNVTNIYWQRNGAVIDSRQFDTKYSGGNLQQPDLVIRHVTRGDKGVYKCVADHVVRTSSDTLSLDVLYPATIVSISDSQTVNTDDRVKFQCVAEGNPPPNITWTVNGMRVRSTTSKMTRDVRTGTVVLDRVRPNATGTYVCTVSNKVGESHVKSLQLNVKASLRGDASSAVAIAIWVGAIAGGLWFVICLGLVVYFIQRRRNKEDKKRFSFYYNMGRREQGRLEERFGEETLEVTRHPHLKLPSKPISQTPSGGITTIRRTTNKGKIRRYARVLHPYHPQEGNELYLEAGDVIEVLEGEDGGWCLGYLSGRIGLFPSNYVKFLSTSQVSAAKLRELPDGAKGRLADGSKGSP